MRRLGALLLGWRGAKLLLLAGDRCETRILVTRGGPLFGRALLVASRGSSRAFGARSVVLLLLVARFQTAAFGQTLCGRGFETRLITIGRRFDMAFARGLWRR